MRPFTLRGHAAFVCASLLLGGCSGFLPTPEPRDSAPPRVPAGLERLPDPVVKPEPPSRYGNKSPYTVLGRTYTVLPTAAGYAAEGRASWYGTKFHGRRTSSGEPYNMFALSAAHRNLPIPSYVRVTNLQNGKSTIVRVNDRGPFHPDRIIDLSYAAAVKLGFADRGTAPVRISVLHKPAVNAAPTVAERYFIQSYPLDSLNLADAVSSRYGEILGSKPIVVRTSRDDHYRVRVGPFTSRDEAERQRAMLVMRDERPPVIVAE